MSGAEIPGQNVEYWVTVVQVGRRKTARNRKQDIEPEREWRGINGIPTTPWRNPVQFTDETQQISPFVRVLIPTVLRMLL